MSIPALPPARSRSLDSDSLSGSLSDSDFVSSSSTPLTVDTAATSDNDEQPHALRESSHMSNKQARPHPSPKQPFPSTPNPRRASSTSTYHHPCSSSLLRTTLFSFARIGLGSATATTTGSPTSSSSRRSSLSSPSSTGSPIESPNLHAKSTTEICTNSNPSLAQFSPTPRALSSLAMHVPHVASSYTSTSRRHGARTRSALTAHSGARARTHSLPFVPFRASADDDVTSPLPDPVTSPGRFASFWRKQIPPPHPHVHPLAQGVSDANSPSPSARVLPSISRAHVPDLVLPIDLDGSSGASAASTAASDGFLKIDGSRDGLSFRTAENCSEGGIIFLGTPRPSSPISQGAEHNDGLTVVVDSPVTDDSDGQPNFAWKGKGKERAPIPSECYAAAAPLPLPAPSASVSIPPSPSPTQKHQTHQTHERRIQIVLPPPPVRASTTPTMLKPRPVATAAPTPPTLATIEKSSRLMRDRVHCATCAAVGVDFPRCPRCAEAWCSRNCRVACMDELADGRRKHVCKT